MVFMLHICCLALCFWKLKSMVMYGSCSTYICLKLLKLVFADLHIYECLLRHQSHICAAEDRALFKIMHLNRSFINHIKYIAKKHIYGKYCVHIKKIYLIVLHLSEVMCVCIHRMCLILWIVHRTQLILQTSRICEYRERVWISIFHFDWVHSNGRIGCICVSIRCNKYNPVWHNDFDLYRYYTTKVTLCGFWYLEICMMLCGYMCSLTISADVEYHCVGRLHHHSAFDTVIFEKIYRFWFTLACIVQKTSVKSIHSQIM